MNKKLYTSVLEFIKIAHKDQFRKNKKTPFVNHPIEVADLLIAYGVYDDVIILAALLHDTIEDTENTLQSVKAFLLSLVEDELFVDQVLFYVNSMTNEFTAESYPNLNRKQRKKKEFDSFKKWSDDKLKLLKTADISCNLKDFADLDMDFAKTYIMEEFEILRILKTDHPLWRNSIELITNEFRKLILR